jgi:manganese transport protein
MAEKEHCDLIAMASHGHRYLSDILHGSTISSVRHKSFIPILLVRAQSKAATARSESQ